MRLFELFNPKLILIMLPGNKYSAIIFSNSEKLPDTAMCCENCGDKNHLRVTMVQTRSSDEGSTLYFYCEKCHHVVVENT